MTGPRLNVAGAALVLGYSKRHTYRLAEAGILPHYKPRGRLSFYEDELRAWLATGKVKTTAELIAEADEILAHRVPGRLHA